MRLPAPGGRTALVLIALFSSLPAQAVSARNGLARSPQSPDDFNSVASQALQNLTSEFSEFKNVVASRTTELKNELQEQQEGNREIDAANGRIVAEVEGLRRSNAALEEQAKSLIAAKGRMRSELQSLGRRLRAAEEFAVASARDAEGEEAAELEAIRNPPPKAVFTTPQPSASEAPATTQAAAVTSPPPQYGGEEQRSNASPPVQVGSSGPPVQAGGSGQAQGVTLGEQPAPKQQEGDAGYADAFAGGDAADSESPDLVESPSRDEDGGDEEVGESFLAVSMEQRRAGRRNLRILPSTADGFANLERTSVAQVQRFFDAALKRVQQNRTELLARQTALNASHDSLQEQHKKLVSLVGRLDAVHGRLRQQTRDLADFLQHLVEISRGPDESAAGALDAMPASPAGHTR